MRDWSVLKRRLPELRLRPEQGRVARYLVDGRSTREIAALTGLTYHQVKMHVLGILYLLGRLPPDDAETADVPRRPVPPPLKPGRAVAIPEPE